tara:strand:- start:93 stop:236 length:144 start_codon:yes stop_codon:yes gene_type:complete
MIEMRTVLITDLINIILLIIYTVKVTQKMNNPKNVTPVITLDFLHSE